MAQKQRKLKKNKHFSTKKIFFKKIIANFVIKFRIKNLKKVKNMFLNKNLKYLRESNHRQSQDSLAQALEITRSAVSSYEDGRAEPKLEVMNRIANYFNISLDQLLNVDLMAMGEEYKNMPKETRRNAQGGVTRVLTITVDKENNSHVEVVEKKLSRAYINGHTNEEFIKDLPKFQIPFLSKGKTYRGFEVSGDAMHPITSGSIVIGEYVEDWNSLKDGQICVLLLKEEGVTLKKVYSKIGERGSFMLKSTNVSYPPVEIHAEDILEIWRFHSHISKDFPEEGNSISELKRAFARLEDEVNEMKTNVPKR